MTDTGARALTADLLARLERHYINPSHDMAGGMFLSEVTYGRAGGSRADALYAGFTTASGRILIGHEVKVTRADWRRELDQPGKADAWADECHAWYVVAPSIQVVKPEELPVDWGLMVPNARTVTRLDVVVKATHHADRQPSWLAVVSLLSRADTICRQRTWQAATDAETRARSEIDQRVADRLVLELQREDAGRLRQLLDEICTALGVQRVEQSDRPSWPGEDWVTLGDLRDAATFLRAHRDVVTATAALLSRWTNPVQQTRERLDALDAALIQLQALTASTTAEEASS